MFFKLKKSPLFFISSSNDPCSTIRPCLNTRIQSNFFSVKSYKYIVNSHDAGFSVSDEIKKALVDMYSHFFETTTVEVGSTFKEEDSMYLYTISVSAVYAGRTYTLTKDISESIVIKD